MQFRVPRLGCDHGRGGDVDAAAHAAFEFEPRLVRRLLQLGRAHPLAPGVMPTTSISPTVTPTSYWPLDPGFGHTSGATAIIGGVAALVQSLATALPPGPGRLRPKAMRALFADPQLGVSTSDAATPPIGRQPDLAKIADRFA